MPEENEELSVEELNNPEKQRNVENNTELASTAIVAGATIYGGEAGQVIASKAVDTKLGQRITHLAGEKIEKINHHVPGGKLAQETTNTAAESGALKTANQYFRARAGNYGKASAAGINHSANPGINKTRGTGYQNNKLFSPKNLAGVRKSNLNSVNAQNNGPLGLNQFRLKSLFKIKEKKPSMLRKVLKGAGKIGIKLFIILLPAIFLFVLIILFMLLLTKEDAKSSQADYTTRTRATTVGQGMNNVDSLGTITDANEEKLLYIGDSRISYMVSYMTNSKVSYFADEEANYNWYIGIKEEVEDYLDKGKIEYVIFNIGLNDIRNVDSLINAFNSLKSKYPSISFYYLSINPVDEEIANNNGYNVTNSDIELFNQKLSGTYGEYYIDSYSRLDSIVTSDAIHYDKNTSLEIHNIVLNYLKTYENN